MRPPVVRAEPAFPRPVPWRCRSGLRDWRRARFALCRGARGAAPFFPALGVEPPVKTDAAPRSDLRRRTLMVKVFRCGPRREGTALRPDGPRWETSQGGSRGGLGGVYGERALRLVAGVGLGLEPCPLFASARAVSGHRRSGNRHRGRRFCRLGSARWAGRTCGIGRSCLGLGRHDDGLGDGRVIMLPGPWVGRVTGVSGRAGRSRSRAWGRRSKGKARVGSAGRARHLPPGARWRGTVRAGRGSSRCWPCGRRWPAGRSDGCDGSHRAGHGAGSGG